MTTIDLHSDTIAALQDQLTGRVILPQQPDYDRLRAVWNLAVEHHPALILVPETAQDVAAGLRYASANGLSVAVQSTGHGQKYAADDALLIITSQLNTVSIDVAARKARVGAGVIWEQVIQAAAPHGLAPLLGSSPHVGVVGYSLGGGVGWLTRKYGLQADSVRAIELVTADGVLRRASITEHSDLFWGLRGGGGNFGIVTAIEFDLYPVASVYGGSLIYTNGNIGETLRFYRDWTQHLPDDLTSSLQIIKFPDLPALPDDLRGVTQVILRAAYIGTDARLGTALIQAWVDWRTPDANTFGVMPFSEIGTISNDPTEPTAGSPSNEMLNALSDAAIDVIAAYTSDPASPLFFHELRHVGGAVTRVAPDSNAIGNRDAQFYLQLAAVNLGGGMFTPEQRTTIDAYRQQFKTALRPYLSGGVYLNFLSGSEAHQRARDAYTPETYARLQALKTAYDPHNLFRYSYHLAD